MQLNRLFLAPLALLAIIVFTSSSQSGSIQQLLRVSSWRFSTLAPLYTPSPSPTMSSRFGQDQAPRYIVVIKQAQPSELIQKHCDAIATLIRRDVGPADSIGVDDQLARFKIGSFEGYVAPLDPRLLLQVCNSPLVSYVERESVVAAAGQPEVGVEEVQLGAPWASLLPFCCKPKPF